MKKFIRSDGNGGTIVDAKPHHLGIGALVTLIIFICGIIFTAGAKSAEIKKIDENQRVFDKRLEKLENCMSDLTEIKTDVRWIKDFVIKNK